MRGALIGLLAVGWGAGLWTGLEVCPAEETVTVRDRTELTQALGRATAGTTVLIEPGTYAGGIVQARLRGTAGKPIVLAAANRDRPPVIEGGASGLHLSSPEHVELRDLIFEAATANGLNIDDSGSAAAPAHHVVLRDIVVREVGPRGNRDGIKLSGLTEFLVDDCRVERWGSGGSAIDMVGCRNGTIRRCRFLDAGGDFANGVQAKGGSRDIVIQRCRFENAGGRAVNIGGHTGLPYFRPKPEDFEARDITVEDCEIRGGMSAICFVGVDGAVVRHNTIIRSTRWPIRILQENLDGRFVPCRDGQFEKNVVVFRSDEVRQLVNIGSQTSPETFQFHGNVWYCSDHPGETRRLVRVPGDEKESRYGVEADFRNPRDGDYRLKNPAENGPGPRTDKSHSAE